MKQPSPCQQQLFRLFWPIPILLQAHQQLAGRVPDGRGRRRAAGRDSRGSDGEHRRKSEGVESSLASTLA